MKNPVVFVDLETGGTRPNHPDIQIAAIAVREWRELAVFERKIQFREEDCDPEALKLNSYDPEVWAVGAFEESDVVKEFAAFVRPFAAVTKISQRTGNAYHITRVAGHKIGSFDAPRLRAMFERHRAFLPVAGFEPLDTWQLALWYFEQNGDALTPPKDFRLETLCRYFNIEIPEGLHDAVVDTRLTIQLARCLCGN